jgi:hypothetical protein
MKWPWTRRKVKPAVPLPPCDQGEAVEALRDANRKLDEARMRRPEVEELAEQLRFHRHANHFAELFRESLGRTR